MFLIFLLSIFFCNVVIADTLLYSDDGVNNPELHKRESVIPFDLIIKSKEKILDEKKNEKIKVEEFVPTPLPTYTITPPYNSDQIEELEKYKTPFIKKEKK